jgi:hypothetical protein
MNYDLTGSKLNDNQVAISRWDAEYKDINIRNVNQWNILQMKTLKLGRVSPQHYKLPVFGMKVQGHIECFTVV